jgi:hypothetical protein
MTEDFNLLRNLDGMDCLYAKAGRPARAILKDTLALGSRAYFLSRSSIFGQLTGHEWCYCSRCGEVRMMKPTGLKDQDLSTYTTDPPPAHPYCKMTPGCLGHMIRVAKRPALTIKTRAAILDAYQT